MLKLFIQNVDFRYVFAVKEVNKVLLEYCVKFQFTFMNIDEIYQTHNQALNLCNTFDDRKI